MMIHYMISGLKLKGLQYVHTYLLAVIAYNLYKSPHLIDLNGKKIMFHYYSPEISTQYDHLI